MPKKPKLSRFQRHKAEWSVCEGCDLCATRKNVVLYRGKIPCDILFIGEAPGASEDTLGIPFVGPAGKSLDGMIEQALGTLEGNLSESVRFGFTNLVACIPKNEEKEIIEAPKASIEACQERIEQIARMCNPQVVVLVGKQAKRWIAGQASLGFDDPSEKTVEFFEIIHPAAIMQMDMSQKSLAYHRCVVTIADAINALVPF